MTGQKRPSKRPQIKSAAVGGALPILTDGESSILQAYRAVDDQAQ